MNRQSYLGVTSLTFGLKERIMSPMKGKGESRLCNKSHYNPQREITNTEEFPQVGTKF